MNRRAHVLGGEDLDGVIHGERGAHGVGAGRRLAPQRTSDEVDALGESARLAIALDPQQVPGAIGEDQEVMGIASMGAEEVA